MLARDFALYDPATVFPSCFLNGKIISLWECVVKEKINHS